MPKVSPDGDAEGCLRMRMVRLLAIAVVLTAGGPMHRAAAADPPSEQPFGGPAPGRAVEERPFGGPPPKHRNPRLLGGKCRTAAQVCDLGKRLPIGSDCRCPEDANAAGTVVK